MLLTACGDKETPHADVATGEYALGAAFPRNGYAVAGVANRLPFSISKKGDAPLDVIDGDVTFTIGDSNGVEIESMVVTPLSAGLTRAFLPVQFTPKQPGIYEIAATYKGSKMTAAVQVLDRSNIAFPQVGDAFGPIATPTTADARGVDPICTASPACSLHAVSLSDAMAGAKPVAVLLSTPAFCQTAICGPVLGLFETAAQKYPSVMSIHAEVYANPKIVDSIDKATLSPFAEHSKMPLEPSLFVIDKTGVLRVRLDSIFDATEVEAALSKVA